MSAVHVVACPRCANPRRTKASGRQRLACTDCGHSFLVRDAADIAPPEPADTPRTGTPSPEPAAAPAQSPTASGAGPAAAGGGIGDVVVLEAATVEVGDVAFPEPVPEPSAAAAEPSSPPRADASPPQLSPRAQPDTSPPAPPEGQRVVDPVPVGAAPGRRRGYYGPPR